MLQFQILHDIVSAWARIVFGGLFRVVRKVRHSPGVHFVFFEFCMSPGDYGGIQCDHNL